MSSSQGGIIFKDSSFQFDPWISRPNVRLACMTFWSSVSALGFRSISPISAIILAICEKNWRMSPMVEGTSPMYFQGKGSMMITYYLYLSLVLFRLSLMDPRFFLKNHLTKPSLGKFSEKGFMYTVYIISRWWLKVWVSVNSIIFESRVSLFRTNDKSSAWAFYLHSLLSKLQG